MQHTVIDSQPAARLLVQGAISTQCYKCVHVSCATLSCTASRMAAPCSTSMSRSNFRRWRSYNFCLAACLRFLSFEADASISRASLGPSCRGHRMLDMLEDHQEGRQSTAS